MFYKENITFCQFKYFSSQKYNFQKLFQLIQQLLKVVTLLLVTLQNPNDNYRIVKNVVTMERSAFFKST